MASESQSSPATPSDLQGQLLIAMPGMSDPRFHKGVLLVLEHHAEGAMAVMVNRPLDAMTFTELLQQLNVPVAVEELAERPVLLGGPVEIGRGFVLHSKDVTLSYSQDLGEIAVTTALEMLRLIAAGTGPEQSLFCLGYAGWTAGQLDDEIRQNSWLSVRLDPALLFDIPLEKRWDAAMALAGVNPDFLSAEAGRA